MIVNLSISGAITISWFTRPRDLTGFKFMLFKKMVGAVRQQMMNQSWLAAIRRPFATMSYHFKYRFCIYTGSGPWFDIKMPSYQYGKSHCEIPLWGISYSGKMTSLYWPPPTPPPPTPPPPPPSPPPPPHPHVSRFLKKYQISMLTMPPGHH